MRCVVHAASGRVWDVEAHLAFHVLCYLGTGRDQSQKCCLFGRSDKPSGMAQRRLSRAEYIVVPEYLRQTEVLSTFAGQKYLRHAGIRKKSKSFCECTFSSKLVNCVVPGGKVLRVALGARL